MNYIKLFDKEYKTLEFDEIKGKSFGFIYVTVNKINGMKYLGLHYKWDKGYIGSGNYFKSAVNKYGKDNFERYIIDTANSYEELCNLEAEYITTKLGVNIAESKDWYNITSGLQRGGNTWAGMSLEDRTKRAEKLSNSLKGKKQSKEWIKKNKEIQLERFKDPKEREKVSKSTKLAMKSPELRKKLSDKKKGIKTNLTPEGREKLRALGKENSKHITSLPTWNKGMNLSSSHKQKLSESHRGHFRVTLNEEIIFEDLNAEGSCKALAKILSDKIGCKLSGDLFYKILKSNEAYYGQKKKIHGLRIKRIGDEVGKDKKS